MKLKKHLSGAVLHPAYYKPRFFLESYLLPSLLVFLWSGALVTEAVKTGNDGIEGVSLSDPKLMVEKIDTDPDEFFLSHDMDISGRLFLGGREGLFVYERSADGGFQPRQELYRFPDNTWIYDIETYGDDLLVLANTALYRLPGAVEKRADIVVEKILWGNPLGHHHQGLHGIEFAPDGDLLICMGDPHPGVHFDKSRPDHLWLWTWYVGPENRPVAYAGVGAVMRLNLDTFDFSVYASGLRNPCGISFDRDWNLFTNDNDQEGSTATPGRLLAVPQHSWNGWARGWDANRNPARRDMIPSVNRALDVPVGQGYYDHTAFGKDYQGSLFVANWGGRNVSRHPIQSDGAGFKAKSVSFLRADGNRRPVSAMPTTDGRLIVSLCYMTGNEPSPQRQTDLLLVSPRESKGDSAFDHSGKSMIDLLSEPIQLRAKAHREILRQGGSMLKEAAQAFGKTTPDSPAFSSLIFLAAAHSDDASVNRITSLAQGEGRAASLAWRAAAARPEKFSGLSDKMISAAGEKKEDAKLLAGLLAFLHSTKRSIPDSVLVLAAHSDPFVRQSAAILLARQAPDDQLAALAEGTTDQRLAATLATVFKLWQRAETVSQLPSGGEVAVEKRTKLLHPGGPIDLRDLGAPIGTFRMADWWKDVKVRKANQTEFDRLQKALADKDQTVATIAATGLFFLNDKKIDAEVATVLEKSETTLSMVAGKLSKAELKKALLALKGAKLSTDTEIPEAFRKIDWDSKTAPKGNVANGKLLFTQRGCVACHLAPDTGAGGSIGPTLIGVGERFPPSYLAASILVPNLTVSPNFHPNTVTMKDGVVHTGFVEPGSAPGIINLRGITGQTMQLDKKNIVKQNASEQSMMPTGLVQNPEEMADLIAYMIKKPRKRSDIKKGRKKRKGAKKQRAAPKKTATPAPPSSPAALKEVLSDWETAGNWLADDKGSLVLTPRAGEESWRRFGSYLWSKQIYKDFEVSFEYKHESEGNSGFYFNVPDRHNAIDTIIEVQIKDSAGKTNLKAHDISGGILPARINPRSNETKTAGEWNQMKVKSLNGDVSITLNGVLVNQAKLSHKGLKSKPKRGYIGFQDHGKPFWLRNLKIRNLAHKN
jgi:putative heme-binding domain-containing protein